MCARRRAQRKFRERQKAKLVESEERAAELERALARMRMEKGALEARHVPLLLLWLPLSPWQRSAAPSGLFECACMRPCCAPLAALHALAL